MEVKCFKNENNVDYYHVDDGYYYRIKNEKNHTLFGVCIKGRCPVRVSINKTFRHGIQTRNRHNHPRNFNEKNVRPFKRRVLKKASMKNADPKKYFDKESFKVDPEVINQICYPAFVKVIQKRRERARKKLPNTLSEYCSTVLGNQEFKNAISGGRFFISGNNKCALFISPIIKTILRTSDLFSVDGTFRCAPPKPKIHQLYTLNGFVGNVCLPIAYCLMTDRKKSSYNWFFKKIRRFEPGWKAKTIITDFEWSAIRSIRETLPDFTIRGCWFHFTKSIRRKCVKLGITNWMTTNPQFCKIVKMAMALPLLPASEIMRGYRHIVSCVVNFTACQKMKLRKLLEYVKTFWLRRNVIEILSVFDCKVRTNNHHEAFHRDLMTHLDGVRCGKHPNIWKFTECLKKIDHVNTRKFLSVLHGNDESFRVAKIWHQQNKNIGNAAVELKQKRLSVSQFLSRMAHCTSSIATDRRNQRRATRTAAINEPIDPSPALNHVVQNGQHDEWDIVAVEEEEIEVIEESEEYEIVESEIILDD